MCSGIGKGTLWCKKKTFMALGKFNFPLHCVSYNAGGQNLVHAKGLEVELSSMQQSLRSKN